MPVTAYSPSEPGGQIYPFMSCAAKQLRIFARINGDISSDCEGVNQRKYSTFRGLRKCLKVSVAKLGDLCSK